MHRRVGNDQLSTSLNSKHTQICPVILAGGAGSRLWPLSRSMTPKQLLPLTSTNSLLQNTLQRLDGITQLSGESVIVCNEQHRFQVAEQIRQIGKSNIDIILEPVARNTAPALTLAALRLTENEADVIMLVLPADHFIGKVAEFQHAVSLAYTEAINNKVVLFGSKPEYAEEAYGYIKLGSSVHNDTYKLAGFVEKPNLNTAQTYVQSTEYLWNSGMYMMKASMWLQQVALHQANMLEICSSAFDKGCQDEYFYRVDKPLFSQNKSDSIDTAIMENLSSNCNSGIVIAFDIAWSDVGVWSSLWNINKKDQNGNVISGDTFLADTRNSYIHSDMRFIAALGLEDTIIVDTRDSLLVAKKNQAQKVSMVVSWLKQQRREELLENQCVFRPWGSYEQIGRGDSFQVKRLSFHPGAALSLQLHHHRAEHWIVIKGTATVTRGHENYLVTENQSTYIPHGVKHKLENQSLKPLEIIEVQSGSYFGEDDIVRFDNSYGRAN